MIRKGQVRLLPKGDVVGQIQFIQEILRIENCIIDTAEIGDRFGSPTESFLQHIRISVFMHCIWHEAGLIFSLEMAR
jgi:hypothetical protein